MLCVLEGKCDEGMEHAQYFVRRSNFIFFVADFSLQLPSTVARWTERPHLVTSKDNELSPPYQPVPTATGRHADGAVHEVAAEMHHVLVSL